MDQQDIQFVRTKDYKLVKEINRGGFGKAVLLRDEMIDELFVCKKYDPYNQDEKEEFYRHFVNEIKLLHLLNDPNIVRVFNYYLYPEVHTGYILMEYVTGTNIEEFIKSQPEKINDIFLQTIKGFTHLEKLKILHRDIRPLNILVTDEAMVKIIDFGFGKQVPFTEDNGDKSISLNWRYSRPSEFGQNMYDFKSEVYFVGKLFEELIETNQIRHFQYYSTLQQMIEPRYEKRIGGFFEVQRSILDKKTLAILFSEDEKRIYREFADNLSQAIASIQEGCDYVSDIELISARLQNAYEKAMLEIAIHNPVIVISAFLSGTYKYYRQKAIFVQVLKEFIDLLHSTSIEKRKIIINNIWQRLDGITRTLKDIDDLPF